MHKQLPCGLCFSPAVFLVLIIGCLGLLCGPSFAENATMGFSADQIAEIEAKVKPALNGKPVTDIPDEDRCALFLAEGIFPDSYNLFFRHGEYLALSKHDYTQAIPRLKKAIAIKPKDLASLEIMALCHSALKEAAEEVACWETLRELIENDISEETRDLRQRVTLNLGRMAEENQMVMRQGRRFIIYTPASSNYVHVADELTDERLEEVYLQVTGDLECIPAYKTSIIVLDPIKFDAVKPASWAGGFAQGGKSMTIKTDSLPVSEVQTRLPARALLLHEYTHNIIHIAADGHCPTWLNEGLAVFAEHKDDSFTEFKPGISSPDNIMTLAQLEKEFAAIRKLDGGPRVSQAYMLAGLYARFIIQNYTMTAPRLILNTLKARQTFDKALFDICELTVAEFETRFGNWVQELANNG